MLIKQATKVLLEMLEERGIAGFDRTDKIHIDTTKEFVAEFAQKLRNTDSSTDNTSDEQLHSDEELMSKIEDMAFGYIESVYEVDESVQFKQFKKELKSLLQTHRNTVFTAGKYSIDVNADAMKLPGKTILYNGGRSSGKFTAFKVERLSFKTKSEESFIEQISDLIYNWIVYKEWKSAYVPIPNLDIREISENILAFTKYYTVKQKDDNLVNEDELLERIKDLLYPDFCKHYPAIIELTTSRQCDNVASKLLELFKTYQNSVLRPVNNSDEQSIIK